MLLSFAWPKMPLSVKPCTPPACPKLMMILMTSSPGADLIIIPPVPLPSTTPHARNGWETPRCAITYSMDGRSCASRGSTIDPMSLANPSSWQRRTAFRSLSALTSMLHVTSLSAPCFLLVTCSTGSRTTRWPESAAQKFRRRQLPRLHGLSTACWSKVASTRLNKKRCFDQLYLLTSCYLINSCILCICRL